MEGSLQLVATNLAATPYQTGLLASAIGCGGVVASGAIVLINPRRTGMIYCVGTGFAILTVVGATIPSYWAAFAAITVSGFACGLFGGVQSAMVMAMVPDELRGRALGVMTMFIGGAPIGCVVLGELAEQLGITMALRYYSACGLALLFLWLACGRAQVLRIRRK